MKNIIFIILAVISISCEPEKKKNAENMEKEYTSSVDINARLEGYKEVELKTDLSHLSENQKELLRLLIDASDIMDELFWLQSYGNKNELLSNISDEATKEYARINYGPWDRLMGDESFINEIGAKPKGANFYPPNMSIDEFENFDDSTKSSQYTLLRYNEQADLETVFYHEAYQEEIKKAAGLLIKASELAENEAFSNYLKLRSEALLSDEYFESDMAWMDMKDNLIDVVIGPIENYEDQLFNYKTAYEAYVLIKDVEWSKKLEKYLTFLPLLQDSLPVSEEYKAEEPGSDSDLNAYDVIYYAGNCNAGGKTIAINLPNDERVQLNKGTRRLQLKNAMRAKFDEIMLPISELLIVEEQQRHVTFDAFFANTMFHEVAHGLGIKNTINDRGSVRKALKEKASAIEEGKADILGVFMVTKLHEMGELPDSELMDYYLTFMAGIFRSIRFGSSSAHGMANMIRFNYFADMNAFEYNEETGRYSVNFEQFQNAIRSLSEKILITQGNGDYQAAGKLFDVYGIVGEQLKSDLQRVNEAGIPKDIVFKQGKDVLGL